MPEGSVDEARLQARRRDLLPLRCLDRARESAFARGFVRTRRPPAALVVESQAGVADEEQPIGDEVQSPGPGWGDVGSGPRPSRRDPHPIGQLLERFVRDRGWQSSLEVASVASRWDEIVGPTVAKHCVVEEFTDDGVLTLRASSSSWEAQIRALLATLEATLAREVGEGVVKKIIVKGPSRPNWKYGRLSVPGRGPRDTYG
ncbi:MAG: DciA family protein [Actinomycetaceae bacterium]|nr:DciA family protein [Actinomycetaceae bacterium]